MGIFFSGTDWENLEERAALSNYFLMLVVGFSNDWKAKVAFKANRKGSKKTVLAFANNLDGYGSISLGKDLEEDVLVVMDCDVKIEEGVPKDFEDRYAAVRKAIEDEAKKRRKREKRG